MGRDELRSKVYNAIKNTGFPLEQRVGYFLQKNRWVPFYSVEYTDPSEGKQRELDILAYKIIGERRIELRISCKKSQSKPWILFTEDSTRYIKHGSLLKITPLCKSNHEYKLIPEVLRGLPFFSHNRTAINFTAFSGKDLNDQARALIRDALYSSITSVYHRPYPHKLMFDRRGTICLFITIFDGIIFESFYNPETDDDEIVEVGYGQWDTRFPLKSVVEEILDSERNKVSITDALYWFSDRFRVEIMTWDYFKTYINTIERVFSNLSIDELSLFGDPWKPENFPNVREAPKLYN
ncbi:hypothetical protein [Tumebacillus permanentifrigoris]|uniref:Uncharacterized protein n=1 Tax=Tumebacillus permanentifrigoris TaxID=378543 RepID=A0A316D654_9BACL|nr:hypothetical protein [Tumebacillus permanentifrigoris]PWK09014.1 hypothetical protein C7459_11480 [Tumebacillus permanentifrigoris]